MTVFTIAVADPIYFGCDGVQDSENKTDFCGVCDGDNSTCTDCEGNVRLGFVNNGTCGKAKTMQVFTHQPYIKPGV